MTILLTRSPTGFGLFLELSLVPRIRPERAPLCGCALLQQILDLDWQLANSGNAGNDFEAMSSSTIALKTACPGFCDTNFFRPPEPREPFSAMH